ncbi:AraC family transcriptional regulator [Pseudomonas sp. NPDC088368]|uniref:AraC family transcriptional regulator n=1 Tax=Pseudomonas sp. NPDC088368 TaxID=3364453 RepID=UPI00380C3B09
MNADHWLKYITAEGIVISQSHLKGDWGIEMASADGSYFHFVAQGGAFFSIDGMDEVQLCAGDLIVLPQGDAHKLKRTKNSSTVSLGHFVKHSNGLHRKDPDATSFLCGAIGIDRHMVMPAIKSLPRSLHLKAGSGNVAPTTIEVLKQLRTEVENAQLGSQVVIRNLLSTLFVYVLREWSENAKAEAGTWFSAMQNPHIAKALACIHERPNHNWTLDRLAQEANLSRSTFANQFRDSVGETPHSYLTRWRLGIAAQLLNQTTLSIGEIAYKVGYRSEFSFNRAFKAARGRTAAKERESRQPQGTPLLVPTK